MPNGRDILQTLISLLEAQEHIKVSYTTEPNGKEVKE